MRPLGAALGRNVRYLWLLALAGLLLTWGCGGSSPENAALQPWPATMAAVQAPLGGPPAPPSPPAAASLSAQAQAQAPEPSGDAVVYSLDLGAGWNMVSLPVVQVTATQLGQGIHPVAFAWEPKDGSYVAVDLNTPDQLNAGAGTRRGLWVYSLSAARLRVTGTPNSGYGADIYSDLGRGWNLVGVPYPAARPLSEVQVQAAGGATRLLNQAVGLEVPPQDPAILLYGYGFVYGGASYESVGLNNPGNSFQYGRAMWVYVHQDGTRMYFQVPGNPETDSTVSGRLLGDGVLVAVDQDGNLFTSTGTEQVPPRMLTLEESESAFLLALPSGATYRFYLLVDGAMYPLYDGPANRFEFAGAVVLDLGLVNLADGRALAQNPPGSAPGVQPAGEDQTAPSLEDPGLVRLGLPELVSRGVQALLERNFLLARAYLGAAARLAGETQSQDADAARFFYALSRTAALGQEVYSDGVDDGLNDLGDFLDASGFDTTRRSSLNGLLPPDTLPATTPTGEDARQFLAGRVCAEVDGALQDLGRVSPSFQRVVSLEGDLGTLTDYECDYGDVLALQAGYRTVRANLLILTSYDLGGGVSDLVNADNLWVETFMASWPNALNHRNLAQLPAAREALDQALVDFQSAIDHILAEADPQADDLLNLPDPDQAREFRGRLDTWRQALTQPVLLRDPQGNTANLDLTRFFDADGLALRDFLFPFDGDEPAGLFQGNPFGDVYAGYAPGGPFDPNRDEDEDGRPDLVSKGEPDLTDEWRGVAPGGLQVRSLARNADGSVVYVLFCEAVSGAPRVVVPADQKGTPLGNWMVPWPDMSGYHQWSLQGVDTGVDQAGNLALLASWQGLRRSDFTWEYGQAYRRYSPQGTLLAQQNRVGFDHSSLLARSLAVLPDGRFLATVGDHLEMFDAAGQSQDSMGGPGNGPGQFVRPTGIDVAPDGTVYVSDSGNDRVQRFSSEGVFLGQFTCYGNNELDVDPTGRVYVRAPSGHVTRFSADGRVLNRWFLGRGWGGGLETFPGHVSLFGCGPDILQYTFLYAR